MSKKRRKRRDYSKKSPLEWFREEYKGRNITRGQLQKTDHSLLKALRNRGQLDEAIPERRTRIYRKKYESPLECFREKFGDREGMTISQLRREDVGLYQKLRSVEQLDEAIPERQRRKRRDFGGNPVEYFREHFGDREGMTRADLKKENPGLSSSLERAGQLGEVIPDLKRRDFGGNPVEYFREHFGDRKMTRNQLSDADFTLYRRLIDSGLIDKAIPEKPGVTYRGYDSPLECFREKFNDGKISRGELVKKDSGLYMALRNNNQLNQAIPEKFGVTYRGYPSHLACFRALFGDREGLTRGQLQREDNRLYHALRNHGQLDQAIPDGNSASEKEKLESVLRNYASGGNGDE